MEDGYELNERDLDVQVLLDNSLNMTSEQIYKELGCDSLE